MQLTARMNSIRRMPVAQSAAKLRLALKMYRQRLVGLFVYNIVGQLLNWLPGPLMLTYRPDSHYYFRNCSGYGALFGKWVAGNRSNNAGDLVRFYMIFQNVQQVLKEGVPGDFVELGVYKGNSAALLAACARQAKRAVYLFDTFEGFDRRDCDADEWRRWSRLFTKTDLERVQRLVGDDSVVYVKGYFPDSLATIELPEQIAVAHIDCDLYEPMKAGLEYFYPRIARGGLIILHDYSSGHWPGVTRAIDEFFDSRHEKVVLIPDKSGTAIVRKI
jgi:predicted O-methyltransferase YrrM